MTEIRKIYIVPISERVFFTDLCDSTPEINPAGGSVGNQDDGWTAPARNARKLYI